MKYGVKFSIPLVKVPELVSKLGPAGAALELLEAIGALELDATDELDSSQAMIGVGSTPVATFK